METAPAGLNGNKTVLNKFETKYRIDLNVIEPKKYQFGCS